MIKTKIAFEDYKDCLFNKSIVNCQQNKIRSRKHIVQTEREEKIALSPHDDKRYLLENSFDTLPWGHFSILEDGDLLDALLQVEMKVKGQESIMESSEVEGEASGVGTCLHKELNSGVKHIRSLDEQEDGEPLSKRSRLSPSI